MLDTAWPQVDDAALVQDKLELVVQINGKLRGAIKVPASASKEAIEQATMTDAQVLHYLEGRAVKKIIVVAGKLVDRRVVTTQPPTLQNIRIRKPGTGPVPTGMVVFEWDSDDPDGGERTYIVRLSRDQGQSWTPIIMNLTRPELALPLKQLSNTSTFRLRITASDGFNTTTITSDPLALSP